MQICIDDCVIKFSVITKKLSSHSISLKDLLIGFVVMWFWFEHPMYFNFFEEWIEDLWNRITMNLWLWACWKSLVLHVLRILRVFFIFKGLWWKFFNTFEAWIRWASLICDFLRFLETFELDSSELWDLRRWFRWFLFECSLYLMVCGRSFLGLWRLESVELHWFVIWWCFRTFELDSRKLLDLGRWFGWFCFECSPILGLRFLKFLEASGLDFNRAFSLLNLSPLNLGPPES